MNERERKEKGWKDPFLSRGGERVKKGEVIARLEDPDRESDVEEVRAEVLLAERRLKLAQSQLDRNIKSKDRYRAPIWQIFYSLWSPWQAHEPRAVSYPPALQNAWNAVQQFDNATELTQSVCPDSC